MPTCDGVDDVVALVAKIEDDPDVLVNFNGPELFYSDWTAPPAGNEGPIYLASSHSGRVIEFEVNVKPQVDAGQVAAVLQPAQRYISRGNVWLMFQKAGAAKPVFFKLRRSDVTSIKEWFAVPTTRSIHLSLNADAFSYGLKVTGEATVTNDPSSGSNPMGFNFPDIEGDVLTPLVLKFPTDTGRHKIKWASAAYLRVDEGGPSAPTAPYYKTLTEETINSSPPSGWSAADVADTGTIGGATKRQLIRSGGVTDFFIPTEDQLQVWDNLPVSDYRVFVRGVSIDFGTKLLFFNAPSFDSGSDLIEADAVTWTTVGPTPSSTGHRDWFDLGVASMPGGAPEPDTMFDLDPLPDTSLWNLGVSSTLNTVLGLDAIMLVPAVDTPDILTRHGSVAFSNDWDSKEVVLDGLNARRYAVAEYQDNPGDEVVIPPVEMTGVLPVVVPNAENRLTFFADTAFYDSDRVSDDKTTTTLIEWSYNPRYINDRPDDS